MTLRLTTCISVMLLLAACAEEKPPISTAEFMQNPRLLEATMVRCGQNRSQMKYEVECINARDAVNRLATVEEQSRRQDLEKQSERKRQALRRTQEAAAEARRRSDEERRRREEEEYLGIFEQMPPEAHDAGEVQGGTGEGAQLPPANAPTAEVASSEEDQGASPVAPAEPGSDLDQVREELRRRQE